MVFNLQNLPIKVTGHWHAVLFCGVPAGHPWPPQAPKHHLQAIKTFLHRSRVPATAGNLWSQHPTKGEKARKDTTAAVLLPTSSG